MPSGGQFSEDYVAELLKRDASDSSVKYSTIGIDALLPRKPRLRAPKPNTRFLRNLIRETDSHNASITAKVADESSRKPNNLPGAIDHSLNSPHSRNSSRRELHHHENGWPHTRELEDRKRQHRTRRSRERSPYPSKQYEHSHGRDGGRDRDHDRRRNRPSTHHRDDNILEGNTLNNDEIGHGVRRRGRRSRSPRERCRFHRYQTRSRSHEHSRETRDSTNLRLTSRSNQSDNQEFTEIFNKALRHKTHRERSQSENIAHKPGETESKKLTALDECKDIEQHKASGNSKHSPKKSSSALNYDSDPLESILGPQLPPPLPKVRRRGRGTLKGSRGIDAHFSSSYDPTIDVRPNSDSEDDWDQALEAMRDRQIWRQQGANRLRAAGFTEEEIAVWDKGREKNEADVRWNRRGEGREWDRGKFIGSDGVFETRPDWERMNEA